MKKRSISENIAVLMLDILFELDKWKIKKPTGLRDRVTEWFADITFVYLQLLGVEAWTV
jgi:hypothetical protein